MSTTAPPLLQLNAASLERGGRILWHDLDIAIQRGEFIAILGANGAGKTSLLKVLLGLLPLSSGSVLIDGKTPRRGDESIGYIPQQKNFDPFLPIRGLDLVKLGITGHRYGLSFNAASVKAKAMRAIEAVGAAEYAHQPIGQLSGGEQQRLRVAQALAGQPELLLCDEPLLSLDLSSQRTITELINTYRTQHNASVLFVTHEINPVLPWVDRVLYMAHGKWTIDTPDKVLQSKTLSSLYETPVEVIRLNDKILVVGADDDPGAHHGGHA